MKYFLIALIFLFCLTTSAFAQAYLDYGIEDLPLIQVFTSNPSLKTLFDPANLVNFTNDAGKSVLTRLDKKTTSGNKVTYLLTTTVDKKPVLKTIIKFLIKEDEELATMVSIKITNNTNGQFSMAEYDGTEETLGEVMGIFAQDAPNLFNVKRINGNGTESGN